MAIVAMPLRGFDSGKNPGRFGCYYGKNAGNCNPKGADSRDCNILGKEFFRWKTRDFPVWARSGLPEFLAIHQIPVLRKIVT
jgi:hypothetical protein